MSCNRLQNGVLKTKKMQENGLKTNEVGVKELGIKDAKVHWNLSSDELAKISVEKGMAQETSAGP